MKSAATHEQKKWWAIEITLLGDGRGGLGGRKRATKHEQSIFLRLF
jgi:hypothetical protein